MTTEKPEVEALAAGRLLTDADREALSYVAGILEQVVEAIVRTHVAVALDEAQSHDRDMHHAILAPVLAKLERVEAVVAKYENDPDIETRAVVMLVEAALRGSPSPERAGDAHPSTGEPGGES